MTDSVMICPDSTDPASMTVTHEALYWDSQGWAQVGGVRIFRPDAVNGVLWVRCRIQSGGAWQTMDMALERRFLEALLAGSWKTV